MEIIDSLDVKNIQLKCKGLSFEIPCTWEDDDIEKLSVISGMLWCNLMVTLKTWSEIENFSDYKISAHLVEQSQNW